MQVQSPRPQSYIGPINNNSLSILGGTMAVLVLMILSTSIVLTVGSSDDLYEFEPLAQWKMDNNNEQDENNNVNDDNSLIREARSTRNTNRGDQYAPWTNSLEKTQLLLGSIRLTSSEKTRNNNENISNIEQKSVENKSLESPNYLASTDNKNSNSNYNNNNNNSDYNEREKQKLFASRKSLLEQILRQYYSRVFDSGNTVMRQKPTIIESRVVSKRHKESVSDTSLPDNHLAPLVWTTAPTNNNKNSASLEDHYLLVERYARSPLNFFTNSATTNKRDKYKPDGTIGETLTADRVVRRGDNDNERYLEAILSAIAHDQMMLNHKSPSSKEKQQYNGDQLTTTTTGAQGQTQLVAANSGHGENVLLLESNDSNSLIGSDSSGNDDNGITDNTDAKTNNDNNNDNNLANSNDMDDNTNQQQQQQRQQQQATINNNVADAVMIPSDLVALNTDNVATPDALVASSLSSLSSLSASSLASSASTEGTNGFDFRSGSAHPQLSMTTLGGALNDDFISFPRQQQHQTLRQHNLVSSPTFASSLASPLTFDANYPKRQIRFHRCYFNPISCFRRR